MTTTAAIAETQVRTLTIEPVCSLEEGVKRFEGLYLDNSYVKHRLTESTRVVTPEGETKFIFLKKRSTPADCGVRLAHVPADQIQPEQALPAKSIARCWWR